MNTLANNPDSPEIQAIENISRELHRLFKEATGRDMAPEVLREEAEDFVAKYGPNADLAELF